jgi:hypothetical protein
LGSICVLLRLFLLSEVPVTVRPWFWTYGGYISWGRFVT